MLVLDLDAEGPLNRQVYRALRGAILEGRLPRTASRRGSARREAGGGRVQLSAMGRRIAEDIPRGAASWSLPRAPLRFDFRYGEPAYDDLPLETWSRLLGRRARRLSVRRLAHDGGRVQPEADPSKGPHLGPTVVPPAGSRRGAAGFDVFSPR